MTHLTPARVRAVLLTGALTLAVALVPASAALAHNVVESTTPGVDETLNQLPDTFRVTTTEPMLELADGAGFAIQIRDRDGLYYGDGCVIVSGDTLSAVPALGDPGPYTMLWQAVSADGHTIDGEVPFYWQPLGTVGEIAKGYPEPPVCGVPQEDPVVAAPTPEPQAGERPDDTAALDLVTLLWVGGVVLAVGVAIAAGLLAARRRSRSRNE